MNGGPEPEGNLTPAGLSPQAAGVTAPSRSGQQGAFLTDVIVDLGLAERNAVNKAVELSRRSTKSPEGHLLESGDIDEHRLSVALAERTGLEHVDLEAFDVDPEALATVERSVAARYNALPIAFAPDGALVVAFEDPYDMLGVSDIEGVTRTEVRPVVAEGSKIRHALGNLPDRRYGSRPGAYRGLIPGQASGTKQHRATPSAPSGPTPAPPKEADRQKEPPPPATAAEASTATGTEAVQEQPQEPEAAAEALTETGTEESNSGRSEGPPAGSPGEGGLATALAELRESATRAASLAEEAERRIGEEEDARARADRLEAELAEAREQISSLEQRLAEMSEAAESARQATERLLSPNRTHG